MLKKSCVPVSRRWVQITGEIMVDALPANPLVRFLGSVTRTPKHPGYRSAVYPANRPDLANRFEPIRTLSPIFSGIYAGLAIRPEPPRAKGKCPGQESNLRPSA